MPMKCSIVIATKDKPELLKLTLASIFKQEPSFNTEVIVVNDSICSAAFNVCSHYGKHIHYYSTGSKRYGNPAHARNVGYLAAKGEVIISQCDDVIHVSENVVENLVTQLQDGEFLLAKCENWEYANDEPATYKMDYCSVNKRSVPYFFCGAVKREDIYAIGGNDEEFTEVCYDDNWFADCLIKGRGLKPRHSTDILTHHVAHGYPKNSHKNEPVSKKLYHDKVVNAKRTGVWQASSGPWPFNRCHIPKVMNFFWSSDRMSWLRYLTLKSFRVHHPDWEVNLFSCNTKSEKGWRSCDVQDYGEYDKVDYYSLIDKLDINKIDWIPPIDNLAPPHACDLMQWETLGECGGFYSDMDILYLKPFDYEAVKNYDVVSCHSRGFMTIGFFGSSPENLLFREVYKEALRLYTGSTYQETGAVAVYSLADMRTTWNKVLCPGDQAMRNLKKRFFCLKFLELSDKAFYPFAWNELDTLWASCKQLDADTIGIHWFGGAKKSLEINSNLTPETLHNFKGNIFDEIRKLV